MIQHDYKWAAGLFEGEGTIHHGASSCCVNTWHITLAMTDEDVVRLFHAAVGIGYVNGPYRYTGKRKHYKPFWRWCISSHADILMFAELIGPYLCKRRTEKLKECINEITIALSRREKKRQEVERKQKEMIPCACGCGTIIHKYDKKGQLRRFVNGNHSRWRK